MAGTVLSGEKREIEADHMSTSESMDAARGSHGSIRRLAVYGSLAPGRRNHHELSDLEGLWVEGTVRGHLCQEGWGAELGYPGIVLDSDAPAVGVQLFDSQDLADQWGRLDEFEGSGYRRSVTTVTTSVGDLQAYIYVLDSG